MNPENDLIAFLRYDLKHFLNSIQQKHIFCKNYDLRMLDLDEIGIMTSEFIILHFKGTVIFTHFSIKRMGKWQSFGYS